MYTHHTHDFRQKSQSSEQKWSTSPLLHPVQTTPPLRERHRARNETSGHLPLRGPEDTVCASPDHHDSLHLVHLGLHQARLDCLQYPVLHLVVPGNLQSVGHHLSMRFRGHDETVEEVYCVRFRRPGSNQNEPATSRQGCYTR